MYILTYLFEKIGKCWCMASRTAIKVGTVNRFNCMEVAISKFKSANNERDIPQVGQFTPVKCFIRHVSSSIINTNK